MASKAKYHYIAPIISWYADVYEDPGVFELLSKHMTESQVSRQLDEMDEAERAAWGRRVALRFEHIEAALGLEPLPQDTYHKIYDIPSGD